MDINETSITQILRLLSDGNWYSVYSIHECYRLSPLEIIESLDFLRQLGVLVEGEEGVRLNYLKASSKISSIIDAFRKRKFNLKDDRMDAFRKPSVGINELYLPNQHLLDKKLTLEIEAKQNKGNN